MYYVRNVLCDYLYNFNLALPNTLNVYSVHFNIWPHLLRHVAVVCRMQLFCILVKIMMINGTRSWLSRKEKREKERKRERREKKERGREKSERNMKGTNRKTEREREKQRQREIRRQRYKRGREWKKEKEKKVT